VPVVKRCTNRARNRARYCVLYWHYNEQLGFTTEQESGRSGAYCTDIAKNADAAVIHVNGSDTDAVMTAGKLAVTAWHKFGRDVW
jgi:2-oxoglutarate dehydrogenase complex dehydrogenase (E1) component-like enzyme